MIKSIAFFFFLAAGCFSQSLNIDHVNPMVGTDSEVKFSHGNTYPAAALPFGMTAWTPSTGRFDDGWIYQYRAAKINGLKATHQPSPWIGDYGDFSLMPLVGELRTQFEARGSRFSHDREISTPYYYAVDLLDS
ncbi:MAG: glycoside hydrolase family 92 protein, partial [Calditrichaeota bacterium]